MSSDRTRSRLECLPHRVLLHCIVPYLRLAEVASLVRTCSTLRRVWDHEDLWSPKYGKAFSKRPDLVFPGVVRAREEIARAMQKRSRALLQKLESARSTGSSPSQRSRALLHAAGAEVRVVVNEGFPGEEIGTQWAPLPKQVGKGMVLRVPTDGFPAARLRTVRALVRSPRLRAVRTAFFAVLSPSSSPAAAADADSGLASALASGPRARARRTAAAPPRGGLAGRWWSAEGHRCAAHAPAQSVLARAPVRALDAGGCVLGADGFVAVVDVRCDAPTRAAGASVVALPLRAPALPAAAVGHSASALHALLWTPQEVARPGGTGGGRHRAGRTGARASRTETAAPTARSAVAVLALTLSFEDAARALISAAAGPLRAPPAHFDDLRGPTPAAPERFHASLVLRTLTSELWGQVGVPLVAWRAGAAAADMGSVAGDARAAVPPATAAPAAVASWRQLWVADTAAEACGGVGPRERASCLLRQRGGATVFRVALPRDAASVEMRWFPTPRLGATCGGLPAVVEGACVVDVEVYDARPERVWGCSRTVALRAVGGDGGAATTGASQSGEAGGTGSSSGVGAISWSDPAVCALAGRGGTWRVGAAADSDGAVVVTAYELPLEGTEAAGDLREDKDAEAWLQHGAAGRRGRARRALRPARPRVLVSHVDIVLQDELLAGFVVDDVSALRATEASLRAPPGTLR